ncbi:MAG: helix-turn-helix domain-containing protein [Bacteroidota bacterium]
MTALKYKVIRSGKQRKEYSDALESLVNADVRTRDLQDEIDLLTVLIEKWDLDRGTVKRHSFEDPVDLVRSLMHERNLRAKDLVEILGVSKSLVSEILNHKKGLSRQNIDVLAKHFNIDIILRYSYSGLS